jgi:hypothetical protein
MEDDMFSLVYENKLKRELARSLAISSLERFIEGTESLDDYNMAVAEYADTLTEIYTSEANHLLIGTDDETSDNKEL